MEVQTKNLWYQSYFSNSENQILKSNKSLEPFICYISLFAKGVFKEYNTSIMLIKPFGYF